jgi:RNA polymerase sigma-70 factor (ECF subfamily)
MRDQSAAPESANGYHRTGGTAPRDEHFDERLLVTQAQSGGSNAFAELYERHRLKIYRTAFRILRNQEDAEDAAQRSFQRAFTKLSRFRGDSTFSTWLTRIAINEALMMLRHHRANRRLLGSDTHEDFEACAFGLADKGPTPEETLAENELRATVTQAISRLRKSLQIVVLLRDLQGLTSAETAQRLGLSVAAVKARSFHARRCLRRHLERNLRTGWSGLPIEKRNRGIVR